MIDRKYAQPVDLVAGGASYANAVAITPSDSDALTEAVAAIYVGAAGTITLVTVNGQVVEFVGCMAGSILPVAAQQIKQTGTSAGSLIGLW